MPNYAHAEIIGHAGRDAEVRYLASGDSVVEVSVAVTRKRGGKETVTWWRVSVFGKPAEWAAEIKKGEVVHASGEPVIEEWTDKEGNKRSTLKMFANSITGFGRWKSGGESSGEAPRDSAQYSRAPAPEPADKPAAPAAGGFGDIDDDIPFRQPFSGGLWRVV